MNDFRLIIDPVKTYKSPNIPIPGDNNPTLLKKLPSRWQKNTKVMACIGLVGALVLSGCVPQPLPPALHGGGSPSPPMYIVYLTEQEALGIIRARLEEAGLDFTATFPGYTIDWNGDEIGLDLFDEQRNVAITYLNREEHHQAFTFQGRRNYADQIEKAFTEQISDIIVGIFYNPKVWEGSGDAFAKEQLITQADAFIAFLQSQGILNQQQEISVVLNGTPVEFDAFPVIFNDQVMVPSHTIFELLGMNVEWYEHFREIHATGTGLTIIMHLGANRFSMNVNYERVRINTPAIIFNNKTLIPLQTVAEAVGADVEWDEDMTTVRITTLP